MNANKMAKRQDKICEFLINEYYRLSMECFGITDTYQRNCFIEQINELQLFLKYFQCGQWKIVEVKVGDKE